MNFCYGGGGYPRSEGYVIGRDGYGGRDIGYPGRIPEGAYGYSGSGSDGDLHVIMYTFF